MLFTIPNAIAFVRLALIPFILHLSHATDAAHVAVAAALFGLAAISD